MLKPAMVAGVLLVALAGATTAPAADGKEPAGITVVGVGREYSEPDTAQLQFAIETTGSTAKEASTAAAAAATRVLEALRKRVGGDGRVETAGFSLSPTYRPQPRGQVEHAEPPEIIGYTAVNQVHVETKKIAEVGAIIDAAIAAGVARAGSLAFVLGEPGPAERRALQAAGADAEQQARAIAEALGVTLGPVLRATTEGRSYPQPRGRFALAAEAGTPIEPGRVVSEAQLRVTYGFE